MSNEDQIVESSRIADAFIARCGDPSKWEYRGEVLEAGKGDNVKCVCGHPIKNLFPIYAPDGVDRVVIGSTCIDHYAAYNPAHAAKMREALAAFLEKKKAEAKAQKDLIETQAVAQKIEEYAKVYERILGQYVYRYQNRIHIGYYWYNLVTRTCSPDRVRQGLGYKTQRGMLKKLTDTIKCLEAAPETARQYPG